MLMKILKMYIEFTFLRYYWDIILTDLFQGLYKRQILHSNLKKDFQSF